MGSTATTARVKHTKPKQIKVPYQNLPDIQHLDFATDWVQAIDNLALFKHSSGLSIKNHELLELGSDDSLAETTAEQIQNKIPQTDRAKAFNHIHGLHRDYYSEIHQKKAHLENAQQAATLAQRELSAAQKKQKKLSNKRRIFNIVRGIIVSLLCLATLTAMFTFIGLTVASSIIPAAFPLPLVALSSLFFAGLAVATGMITAGTSMFNHYHYKKPLKKLTKDIEIKEQQLSALEKKDVKTLRHEIHKLFLVGSILEILINKLAPLEPISKPEGNSEVFSKWSAKLPELPKSRKFPVPLAELIEEDGDSHSKLIEDTALSITDQLRDAAAVVFPSLKRK